MCGCSYVTYVTTATERAAHTPPFPPVELLSSVASESVSAERPKERARPAPPAGAKTWAWRRLGLGAARQRRTTARAKGGSARDAPPRAAQPETLHQGRLCLRRSTKGGSARDAGRRPSKFPNTRTSHIIQNFATEVPKGPIHLVQDKGVKGVEGREADPMAMDGSERLCLCVIALLFDFVFLPTLTSHTYSRRKEILRRRHYRRRRRGTTG